MQEWEEKIIEKRKAREEGLAEGRKEGLTEGLAEGRKEGALRQTVSLICKKLKKGQSPAQIAELLEEETAYIEKICKIAEKYAPEYDIDQILQEMGAQG